ncbi:hypothetical protein SPI_02868 [Niveomyces insectorum RCEF 264]|uniref:Mating-type switching protein swi10 n=1 Tax=Niveomyces insectorum RCEF 264 TaxID=1081102 RepID=A0A167WV94_9HYPO|nr:hypothetical protein SPI_02868 [Niveomyces insectorum RCEF 264]
MATTTERRRSFSQQLMQPFLGFRQDAKRDSKYVPAPDNTPKLRRKLQKVTKQLGPDGESDTVAASGADGDVFLSTKYESLTCVNDTKANDGRNGKAGKTLSKRDKDSSAKDSSAKDKRASRDSKPRFFFRSASTSRVAEAKPSAPRSASCSRAPIMAMAGTRPTTASSINGSEHAGTTLTAAATHPTPNPDRVNTNLVDTDSRTAAASNAELPVSWSIQEAEATAEARKKDAQNNATHTRTLQLMEAQERASAHQWAERRRSFYDHGLNRSATPAFMPTASQGVYRNKPAPPALTVLPPPSQSPAPWQQQAEYRRSHRSHRHSQYVGSPAPREPDAHRTFSTYQSSYASRKSVVPMMPIAGSPSPSAPSSAVSRGSSASLSSPTSAAFSFSSGSQATSPASSFSQPHKPYNAAAPLSPPGSSSSHIAPSAGFSDDGFRHRRDHGYHTENDSCVVPELFYLTRGNSRGPVPATPDSPVSTTSVDSSGTKTRRKVKTPVYAIGQLETANASVGVHANEVAAKAESKYQSPPSHGAFSIQTPPDSPVFSTAAYHAVTTNTAELSLLQSKSSIECIAEEYRALLVSRNSQGTDAQSECDADVSKDKQERQPVSAGQHHRHTHRHHNSNNTHPGQRKFLLASPSSTVNPQKAKADVRFSSPLLPSPMSQDRSAHACNVPAVEPRRITNNNNNTAAGDSTRLLSPKPPALRSHRSRQHNSVPHYKSSAPQPDNLSLQLCVELLARELSSAVTQRSSAAAATAAANRAARRRQQQQHHPGVPGNFGFPPVTPPPPSASALPTTSAGSALQILVMIEAYEQLRDRLVAEARQATNRAPANSAGTRSEEIEAMFGFWLQALYRIHDSLTCSSSSEDENGELDNTSESEYDSTA